MRKKSNEQAAPKMQAPPRIKPPLMGTRLPPFSGDSTKCTKCEYTEAKTLHFAAGRTCVHLGEGTLAVWGVERLHRICDRCHFTWDEACVPAIPAITQQTMVMPAVRND